MKWYNSDDIPLLDIPMIIYTKNKNMMILKCPSEKSWKWYVGKYNIKNWIYCDEIKPMNI